MSTAQHTPGPWWITPSGVRDRGGYICHTNPAQRYEGQDERFAQETAERTANKLLIAAAPALLEALQPFVEHNSSEETITITVRTADVTRARAAIAKTTGGAP